MKTLLIAGTLCCCSPLTASLIWDFTSGIDGWNSQNINFVSSGGWGQYVADGFTDTEFQDRMSSEGGYLGAFMFASIDAGDISQYKGGHLNLRYKDTGAGDRGDGMTPPEYLFLSGQINGQNTILGYELKFSEDWQTVSISIDKSTLPSCIITKEESMPGSEEQLNFSWAELSDEEFDQFLSNVSIHLRSDSYMKPGSVGGENEWMPISIFDSVSIIEIPEVDSFAIAAGISVAIFAATRRKRKTHK